MVGRPPLPEIIQTPPPYSGWRPCFPRVSPTSPLQEIVQTPPPYSGWRPCVSRVSPTPPSAGNSNSPPLCKIFSALRAKANSKFSSALRAKANSVFLLRFACVRRVCARVCVCVYVRFARKKEGGDLFEVVIIFYFIFFIFYLILFDLIK